VVKNTQLQRLNKRQVDTYLQDNNCSIDLSLNSQIPNSLLFAFDTNYQCINGKVLAVSKDGSGNLYASVNNWQAEINELIELNKMVPVHILYNQIPSQDKFIQEIPSLVSQLAQEFKINPNELDKSLESLLIIDRVFESNNQITNNQKTLGLLIAYIGEVVKGAVSGEWFIKQGDEPDWEPVIVDSSGKIISFCILIFDELHESEVISFHDLVSMLLESHQH
jgi:hypothetical protein